MEYIRETKFTLYVDTNKQTIEKSFSSLSELLEYVHNLSDVDEVYASLMPDLPADGIWG